MTVLIVVLVVIGVLIGFTLAFVLPRRRTSTLEPPSTRRVTTDVVEPEIVESELEDVVVAGDDDVVTDVVTEVVVESATAPTDVDAEEVIEEVSEEVVEEVVEPAAPVRFRDRLSKARNALSGAMGSLAGRNKIDAETWDELEEALILADVGVAATQELLETLRTRVKSDGLQNGEQLLAALKTEITARLVDFDRSLHMADTSPTVWLFVGVNGVGKTTTIGKLGAREKSEGRSVLMAAGDTFRAAAAEQLGMWAERSGAELVRGAEGSDPSAVIFDGVEAASARGIDLVLADTAGRLHTKTNLMDELRKVRRVADKGAGTVTEVLLVIDATTGQNGLVQAKQFTEAVELTGVVLTKLDGSAKGGIVIAIHEQLGIPVKLVGLGEGISDLVEFNANEFVEALFEQRSDS